jgi:hypothetical protein
VSTSNKNKSREFSQSAQSGLARIDYIIVTTCLVALLITAAIR